MSNALFNLPKAKNEPVLNYEPGSDQRESLKKELKRMSSESIEIPMYINGERVMTDDKKPVSPPHDHQNVIAHHAWGNQQHVKDAINAALNAKGKWAAMPWQERAAIFLKAADLISGPWRDRMNAATMLGQSKNVYQSEIDAVAELCDFFRFNAEYMQQIYTDQPFSPKGIWNRLEYRPLEGFIFAITPFNFTSIAGNLPGAPALMGNTCVWKPAEAQIYSARIIMEILMEAGLPDGVINLIYTDGPETGEIVFNHQDFAGLHFTGSTKVFQHLWKTIGQNIGQYKSYPRVVGETGGKDYIFAHPSSDVEALATAISRGAFEFQGQKCSAASRCYIPRSIYSDVMSKVISDVKTFGQGDVQDFSNFINAVITEDAFDKISGYIDKANDASDAEIIVGGGYDKSKGYFIEPTIIKTSDPKFLTMREEIFGPVLTVYEYSDADWEKMLDILDDTSPYALTGAIFGRDRYFVEYATRRLSQTAGNFYINDKPTGAVVGQQPFGGARASGTNDKAGSYLNLIRWVSPRTIKETFDPPKDYRYPFLGEG